MKAMGGYKDEGAPPLAPVKLCPITIEACAAALEREAERNEWIVRGVHLSLSTRLDAENSANIKRNCAALLRAMKQ